MYECFILLLNYIFPDILGIAVGRRLSLIMMNQVAKPDQVAKLLSTTDCGDGFVVSLVHIKFICLSLLSVFSN